MGKTQEQNRQTGIFGQLIRNIRELQGISPEELARGICSTKALKKYETGEREPDILTAEALFGRLKKSMEKFEAMLSCTEHKQLKQRMGIQLLLREGKLAEAEKKIEDYAKINLALHYQYACFLRAEFLRKTHAPLKEQICNVVDGIYQTSEARKENTIRKVTAEEMAGNALKPEMLLTGRYSKMELYLLERYAILLEENGEPERAVLWYQAIVDYLEDERYDRSEQYSIYPIMAYKLAGYYETQCLYTIAMEWIGRGCEMLRKRKSQLPLFCKLMELKFKIEDCPGAGRNPDFAEREAYRKMCDSVAGCTEDWKENWYPMYREVHRVCFNDIIRERRIAKGMSRMELAYGICDVRTLERMEACQNTPRAWIRERLLEKLGLPLEKYNGGIVTKQYADYRRFSQMRESCRKGEYQEAKSIYEELKKGMDMKNITNEQWAEYWDIRIEGGLGHVLPKVKEERLWALLRKTVPIKRDCPQFECQLMEHERNIWNQIAEGGAPEDGKIRKFQLKQIWIYYQEREKRLIEPQYLVQLLTLFGDLTRREGKATLALRYLHIAEKKMVLMDEWHFWEYILCHKQIAIIETGTEKNDFQCARQAYAVSCLYAKNPMMCDYLIECFGENICKIKEEKT